MIATENYSKFKIQNSKFKWFCAQLFVKFICPNFRLTQKCVYTELEKFDFIQ